jgi:hypothetical protein
MYPRPVFIVDRLRDAMRFLPIASGVVPESDERGLATLRRS